MTLTLFDVDSSARCGPTGSNDGPRADRPRRRSFTSAQEARILAEYNASPRGERGAVLRREGLYDTHLIGWRKAAATGAGEAPQPGKPDPRDKEIADLQARAE